MLSLIAEAAHSILNAPAFPAVLLAWQTYALLSELLLAATHLKVLLCIGKPLPAKDLSNKRWTYFLYDLISPWFSLASIITPYMLPVLATAAHRNSNPSGLAQTNGLASSSIMISGNTSIFPDTCSPLLHPYSQQPYSWCPAGHYSATNTVVLPANSTAVPGLPALDIFLPENILEGVSLAEQLFLLFVGAHAALHVYYISSWHSAHSKNVVEMSASSSMKSRIQKFNLWEVVWFFVGTSYDILTHVVMCGLLLQSLGSSYSAFRA